MHTTAGDHLAATASTELTIIAPARAWAAIDLPELWRYRSLVYFLAWRDVKVRYKQTVLGVAWAVLQPLAMMLVLSIFLGWLSGVRTSDVPYPLFVLTGLLPWTYFAHAVTECSSSLVANINLLSKVYFPRLVLPTAAVLGGLVDLGIASMVLGPVAVWFNVEPSWRLVALPLFVSLILLSALAVGIWLSALTVRFRDVRYVVPFLLQIWFFATPVAYPSSIVPPTFRSLYGLNPMVGAVEGFRWVFFGAAVDAASLVVSAAATLILLVSGMYYFRRTEQTFADVA